MPVANISPDFQSFPKCPCDLFPLFFHRFPAKSPCVSHPLTENLHGFPITSFHGLSNYHVFLPSHPFTVQISIVFPQKISGCGSHVLFHRASCHAMPGQSWWPTGFVLARGGQGWRRPHDRRGSEVPGDHGRLATAYKGPPFWSRCSGFIWWNHPQMAELFRLVKYYHLSILYIYIYM